MNEAVVRAIAHVTYEGPGQTPWLAQIALLEEDDVEMFPSDIHTSKHGSLRSAVAHIAAQALALEFGSTTINIDISGYKAAKG